MRKLIVFLIVFFILINISYAFNENKIWINLEILNVEKPIKVGDGAYYRLNLTNLGDSSIKDEFEIKLSYPSGKQISLQKKEIEISPRSSVYLIQETPREGEYAIIDLNEVGTYHIKVISTSNLDFYECNDVNNLTTDNVTKDFCSTSFERWTKEISVDFEVVSEETKNLINTIKKLVTDTEESTKLAIDIAEESKRIALWSFYLVLLALLISFFNYDNVLYNVFKKTFLYRHLKWFQYELKKKLKPILRRGPIVFYSSILLVGYLYTGIITDFSSFIPIILGFVWLVLMGFYFILIPFNKHLLRMIGGLVGFILLIYLSVKILQPYYGHSDPLMFLFTPILTHILWLGIIYLKDFFMKYL